MLYPIENEVRSVLSLDGMWDFALEKRPGEGDDWKTGLPEVHDRIYVPASYNDQKEDPVFRAHTGKVYYERSFTVPKCFAGQRLFLRFDAVTHESVVWLDGQVLMRHKGGFLPFESEITDCVKPGGTYRVTVCADNTINHSTLPVGNDELSFFGSDNAQVPAVKAAKKHRGTVNLPNFDFFNYAGIQRHVRLYTVPEAFVSDVSIVTDYAGSEGRVSVSVRIDGAQAAGDKADSVVFRILDRKGNTVSEGEAAVVNGDAAAALTIPDVRLWNPWPEDPYLYQLEILYGEDHYSERFGVRTVRVEDKQLLINGRPFYFKGFGKHEDFYIHGRGTDQVLNVKDVSLLHWIGANSFRTSHYPYAEEMYRLCDEEGIVIIDETPAVGLNGGDRENCYQYPVKAHHEDVIRDLIARDRNHPSVIMWSLGNEPDTENHPEDALQYWRSLYTLAHSLDPQDRPVTLVCCQNDYTRDLVTRTMDVVCINRYYGWYNLSGDLDSAVYAWNLELDFWAEQGKPVMVTEYGADTLPGLHTTVPEMWTEEFQKLYFQRLDEEVFDKRDFFIGEHCWAFADFNTIQGVFRADGNRKGVFNRERRPKLAAHYLKSRWEKIPNFGYKNRTESNECV